MIYSPFSGDACDVRVNLYAILLVLFDINRIASSAIDGPYVATILAFVIGIVFMVGFCNYVL